MHVLLPMDVAALCSMTRSFPRIMSIDFHHYVQIGDVIRYAGSFCAMIYMYFLPCIVKLIQQKEELGVTSFLKLPIWSLLVHGFLIFLGVLLFVFQFLIDPYNMANISNAYRVTEA